MFARVHDKKSGSDKFVPAQQTGPVFVSDQGSACEHHILQGTVLHLQPFKNPPELTLSFHNMDYVLDYIHVLTACYVISSYPGLSLITPRFSG